ncbi:hypothetical protein GBA52_004043 [Prunus armeniaca]|nr:hypothetical protein GBA52_004043 [Prunus armeniaca]
MPGRPFNKFNKLSAKEPNDKKDEKYVIPYIVYNTTKKLRNVYPPWKNFVRAHLDVKNIDAT